MNIEHVMWVSYLLLLGPRPLQATPTHLESHQLQTTPSQCIWSLTFFLRFLHSSQPSPWEYQVDHCNVSCVSLRTWPHNVDSRHFRISSKIEFCITTRFSLDCYTGILLLNTVDSLVAVSYSFDREDSVLSPLRRSQDGTSQLWSSEPAFPSSMTATHNSPTRGMDVGMLIQ